MFQDVFESVGGWAMVIFSSLNQLVLEVIGVIPELIVSIIIWWVGQWLLDMGISWIKKLDIGKTRFDNRVISTLVPVLTVFGRVILVLIILDYLGIGRTVIAALTQGLTFAVAIALGISFGKALEPEAKQTVDWLKDISLEKKSKNK